jgi:threonine dehydrogenase-like Zn-dependent dehydrogenase
LVKSLRSEELVLMPTNTAAWIKARKTQLEVGPAPYTPPGDDQIVVRNHAVAINPLDWIIQVAGNLTFRWLNYPTVLGADVAGEVVEVGQAVTRFRVGDRVLGHAVGTDKDSNRAAEGAFQQYTVLLERMTSPDPGHDALHRRRRSPAGHLYRGLRPVPDRPAGAAAPDGERRADRTDAAGVGWLDERRQQCDLAGGRGRL